MNMKLDSKKIEALATDIFEWLNEHSLWVDVAIYFNGKCWSTSTKDKGEFCYNEHRYFEYEADPKNYFQYVAEPNILSMSFEGDLYSILNGYAGKYGFKLEDDFMKLFEKYGLYFELGNAWNLTTYMI